MSDGKIYQLNEGATYQVATREEQWQAALKLDAERQAQHDTAAWLIVALISTALFVTFIRFVWLRKPSS
ncbi:putative Co/Zn/Cd cation transporter (cation efflux family) [Pararhizobium capsulatum DSM 1112]|uniref:Co/Zn/Cd cation transporter (Cation efflux family) n=1 Tax=Pararhizobium capsulatum DSM 1112 TaxID=1121113 RepID=A0ABU0C3Q1_9HYPH|nr:hypothetical protein [Pararhizobium capsulatum]MDQ0323707.1 putative Co/Zn/Cd cation transporter (cation efflux family) [Pararhizobium capsulatum DSM 1112]